MKELLVVAAGGAFGAVFRYLVYVLAGLAFGTGFPFGTLIVNIVGSFVMGVLAEGMALAWEFTPEARLFLTVGILGAFTTFSTFSLDVAVLYERGRLGLVAGYILISVICSIGALFAGLYLMRRVYAPAL
ncbi:MAG: fluoride efflux transporter CrcB [Rhodospirillales bacterium]|nr:fluoride efflux transporter CrcB [Rhodospirillales bacterium]